MRPNTGSYPESSATRGSANWATACRTESICALAFALRPGFEDCAWSIGAAATMAPASQDRLRRRLLDMSNATPARVGSGGCGGAARCRSPQRLRPSANDVDPPGHLADVGARHPRERLEVDHLDRSGFRADALDRDERVPIVTGDGDPVYDPALCRHTRELLARRDVDDGDGLSALVRAHQQLAIACDGKVVDTIPGGDASLHRPRRDVYLDDVVRLVARDEHAPPISRGLSPGGRARHVAGLGRLHAMPRMIGRLPVPRSRFPLS